MSIWVREHPSILRERCLKSRMPFLFCFLFACLFSCFSLFSKAFPFQYLSHFGRRHFSSVLVQAIPPLETPDGRETGAHSLGGVLFFKDVCPAATIIPRILQGFHLPAFRAPFFILQPAQLEPPEEKEKQVKIIIIKKKYKATFPLPSPSPPN